MEKKDCYYLGKVNKLHGYKGELTIFLDVDNPKEYEGLDMFFVDHRHSLLPVFIESICLHTSKNTAVVKLEDVNTEEEAQMFVNKNLYLPLDTLPPLNGNQFYYHEVIGFAITDKVSGVLGKCEEVLDYKQQALFKLHYQDKEILIPINDDIIIKVDREAKSIEVSLPEGLLEVFLES